jgi:Flp pilus assembly protein TadG
MPIFFARRFRNARDFAADARGNVAMIFGLSLLPIFVATGASIDYGRMSTARTKLQNAADVIALTIAKDIEAGRSQTQIRADIGQVFQAEMDTKDLTSWTVDYTFDQTNWVVKVDTSAVFDSVILDIINITDLRIGAESEATYGTDNVEIALVLDNTGSMNSSSKLSSLKTAANAMIDRLAESQAGKDGKVSVAIIPFGVSVKVGTEHDDADWLGPRGTYQSCSGPSWNRVCTTQTRVWTGCVGDRAAPHTNTAAAVDHSQAATRFPRDYFDCTTATILPLTKSFDTAKAKITSLVAGGNTNVPIGAMWGWTMLRKGAPLSNAQETQGAEKVAKYAIILTDGENTENTLGQSRATIDANTTAVCTNIKAAGITVFTIRVIDGNATLLRNCATTPDYYFDVSNPAALTGVFEKILMNITKLRLSS